jgi:hypothetical protein
MMCSVHQAMQIALNTTKRQTNQMNKLVKKWQARYCLLYLANHTTRHYHLSFSMSHSSTKQCKKKKRTNHTCLSFFNILLAKARDALAWVEEEFSWGVNIWVVTRTASSKTWLRGKTPSRSSIAFLRNFIRPGLCERSCMLPSNYSNL